MKIDLTNTSLTKCSEIHKSRKIFNSLIRFNIIIFLFYIQNLKNTNIVIWIESGQLLQDLERLQVLKWGCKAVWRCHDRSDGRLYIQLIVLLWNIIIILFENLLFVHVYICIFDFYSSFIWVDFNKPHARLQFCLLFLKRMKYAEKLCLEFILLSV